MFNVFAELQKYQKIKLDGPTSSVSPHTAVFTQLAVDFQKMAKHQFRLEQQFDAFSEELLELFQQQIATQSNTILGLNRQLETAASKNIRLVWGLIQLYDALDLIALSIQASGSTDWVAQMERLTTATARVMTENGLQFLGAEPYFDDQLHEAVGTAQVAEKDYKAIVTVEQKGYTYLGQVLRKAQVIVNIERRDESGHE
jgi:molecular chaperone GrpE (heat shock protein)